MTKKVLHLFITALLLMILTATLAAYRHSVYATSISNQSVRCGAWNVIPAPSIAGATNADLYSIAAVSANDIWAVGSDLNASGQVQTLIEQWNGTQWSVVSSPNNNIYDHLYAVAAVSANNVWAVGYYGTPTSQETQALIEHWDGTQWSVVPGPNPTPSGGLDTLSINSATDIWAIGMNGSQLLIEHWDGTNWSIISSPSYWTYLDDFHAAIAVSSNNVWVVGRYETNNFNYRTLTVQWNGTQWSIIPSPNIGALNSNELNGVVRVPGTNQLWAVGDHFTNRIYTLTEYWNGKGWSTVASPSPGTSRNMLFAAAAISARSIWAVGYYQNDSNGNHYPLIEHWNGSTWSVTSNPKLLQDSVLQSVARVPGTTQVWAVGRQGFNTLAEFYC